MANGDFSQKKAEAPGGFDAGSYRPQAESAPARSLTPAQQKLAGLEKALPAPLKQQAAAALLALVIVAGSVVGIGGAKLRGRYNEAKSWYSVGVAADNGYTLSEELTERAFTAANVITSALNTQGLGSDSPEVTQAQQALEQFEDCQAQLDEGEGSMHAMYEANAALDSAIDQLYAKMQELAEDPLNMGAVQTQYGRFNSAGTILGSLHYNEEVTRYQGETGGFPANLLGALFGIEEVELFA